MSVNRDEEDVGIAIRRELGHGGLGLSNDAVDVPLHELFSEEEFFAEMDAMIDQMQPR